MHKKFIKGVQSTRIMFILSNVPGVLSGTDQSPDIFIVEL